MLCNACGLFLKLHGRARPISLKTDVIKSRNRVRVKKTAIPQTTLRTAREAEDAVRQQAQQAEHTAAQVDAMDGLSSPTNIIAENSAIAPQHVFDGMELSSIGAESMSYDALLVQNTSLRIRVSELEVINDLFKGRVSELEQAEKIAKQSEQSMHDELQHSRNELQQALHREADLRRQLLADHTER